MRRFFVLLVLMLALVAVGNVFAQEGAQPVPVTDDEVNRIAKKLFCPVCENIPLDACGTAACEDWRNAIRLQLEAGMTDQQIVDDFVRRFGDRVVGTPQDPTLRFVSLAIPFFAVLAGAFMVFKYFGKRNRSVIDGNANAHVLDKVVANSTANTNADLYSKLEEDVKG